MRRHVISVCLLAFALLLGGRLLGAEGEATTEPAEKPSVTVYPVVTRPQRGDADMARRIGLVVATFLERAGMTQLEVADTVFQPPETEDVAKVAAKFGKLVESEPIKTDYAVFVELLGTPKTGLKEIRTIVVDKSGKTVLAESVGKVEFAALEDPPKDPMSCCVFVAQRLQKLWDLEDPLRDNAPQGKMARFWKRDAGSPSEAEQAEIAERFALLQQKAKSAAWTVYPPRVGRESDKQCAVDLAAMLAENDLGKTEVSKLDPSLDIARHSNEQKVLWNAARAFRDFLKKNPPKTDYAVYADYALFHSGTETQVGYVHFIVCDRAGDWVLIDYQNSHHEDFEAIGPKTTEDCHQLVVKRLKRRLAE